MTKVRCPHCGRVDSRAGVKVSYDCSACGARIRAKVDLPPGGALAVPLPAEVNSDPSLIRTTLVPVDDSGTFLVLGDDVMLGLDLEPLPFLHFGSGARGHSVAQLLGLGDAALQGLQGLQNVQGLVRLAPETLAALKAGATPLAQGGWNLGSLQMGGKIASTVRWAPAGAAGTLSVLAAMGPALAIVAVQWQLGKIAKRVEKNIQLTSTVLIELRTESWYDLQAAAGMILEEAQEVMSTGEITTGQWQHLQSQALMPTVAKHRAMHLAGLQGRADGFISSRRGQGHDAWADQHYTEMLRNVQGVLVAEQATLLYAAMRAAHLRSTADPAEVAHADRVLTRAIGAHQVVQEQLDQALRGMYQGLSLQLADDPQSTVRLGGKKLPISVIKGNVLQLHRAASDSAFRSMAPLREPVVPRAKTLMDIDADKASDYLKRVRWLLKDGETIDLMARGDVTFRAWESRCLAVLTGQRLLLVDRKALMNGHWEGRELNLASVRVRTRPKDGERDHIRLELGDDEGDLLVYNKSEASLHRLLDQAAATARAVEGTATRVAIDG